MKNLKDFFYWLDHIASYNIRNFFLTGFFAIFVITLVALLFLAMLLIVKGYWYVLAIPFFLTCFGVPVYEYWRYKNDKL